MTLPRILVVAVVLGMDLAVQAGDDVPALGSLARAGRLQIASWATPGGPAAGGRRPGRRASKEPPHG